LLDQYDVRGMNMDDKEEQYTMDLLSTIERSSIQSQRGMSQHMGVALGVVNACLKRCVKKGWIKMQQTPAQRYAYFVTPTGFAEKARLTKRFVSHSFALYRKASAHYQACFEQLKSEQHRPVVLVGYSDLTEIALLWAKHYNIEVKALHLIDQDEASMLTESCRHLGCYTDITSLPAEACMVVTSLLVEQQMLDDLLQINPRSVVPLKLL
jgi:DNA-binding MarR family transcriptional regulator